ncbi:hypothetical protein [Jeotgalibacillus aurantiacus]|uniref:hypothetical protein n=1 Tax=Jeotgalibacillus aurantiacus TaxID=2763266 RepID=UPI001D0B00DD|nr:hypothetical protein [Jeotgalibacillus aurantiacus]
MPEFSYFFNANEVSPGVYDRVYLASDFADYFGDVLSSGLLHVDGQPSLKAVVQNGTLETIIEPGRAIIKGYRYKNTTDKVLTHNIADPTLDRIDRFVVRHDLRNSERETVTVIKEGEYAENPVPPALQRDNFIYEISLGQVRVRANTSSLEATDFIDERLDEDLCGLVYSLISIPTDQLQAWITARQAELQVESDQFSTDLADATAQLQQDLLDFAQIFNDWFEEQQGEGFLLASEKGQVNGVGTLNGAGKQPTAEVNTEVADFLTTHPAEDAVDAHNATNISLIDSGNLFTATDVEGAMSELFINVSDGKDLIGGAITDVDPSVVIPTDPSFQDLATGIGQISTGVKKATGTLNAALGVKSIMNTLDFTPSTVILDRTPSNTHFYFLTLHNIVFRHNGGTRSSSSFGYWGSSVNNNMNGILLPYNNGTTFFDPAVVAQIVPNGFEITVNSSILVGDVEWTAYE